MTAMGRVVARPLPTPFQTFGKAGYLHESGRSLYAIIVDALM